MGTHGETLLDPLPTAAAILGGIGRWDGYDSTASICCFAFEDGSELCPPSVIDRCVEASLCTGPIGPIAPVAIGLGLRPTSQVGHLQVFQIDRVILAHQGERRRVVEVRALPAYRLMLLGQEMSRLLATFAPLLPSGHPALGLLQGALGSAVVPGILHHGGRRRDEKDLQADIDTRLTASWWQGLRGNVSATEAAVPTVRFMGNGDRFDGALKRATPPHGKAPNL